MKQIVCSVFDSAAQVFGRPFFVVAKGQAIRSFSDEVQRQAPDNELARHPDDFTLYQLAEFDDAFGAFVPVPPEVLIRGKDCLLPKE